MNLRKLLKWSLVLMAIVAYKQLEASDGQDEYTRLAYSAATHPDSIMVFKKHSF
jgi:hypothetical protein